MDDEVLGPELAFENSAAQQMSERIHGFFRLSNVEVPLQVDVKITEAPEFAERFPAVLTWKNGEEKATVLYSREAVSDVASEFDTDAKTFAAVEQLYLAGSIALGVLLNSLGSTVQDQDKVNLLVDQFTDMTEVERGIDLFSAITADDKVNIKHALCRSSTERLCRIGALRFVTGIYAFLKDDVNGFEDLRKSAHESILNALNNRKKSSLLLKASHVFTDAEVTDRLDRQFVDAISEVSLALAFPMDHEELRSMVVIATANPGRTVYNESDGSIAEVPREGFYEVD